mmetsp:Transcript_43756/g.107426  ORF Transcript_43756/g.107426 Transcript_43756/m.107426 type:complete len:218 (+) Transcript_43756:1357-2010(+)
MIAFDSGKCTMYLFSGLHGHGLSSTPCASGAPSECMHGTNWPSPPRLASAASPMRVMTRIDATTYGESVTCTPIAECSLPSGPIENGTTYMVRPFMASVNSDVIFSAMSSGSAQLLSGPASIFDDEQMNVCSSTRATSPMPERARYEFGRSSSFSLTSMPLCTIWFTSSRFSASLPSHRCTRSGLNSATCFDTQLRSASFVVHCCRLCSTGERTAKS